uniref:Hva1_TUDOR domain-containing protein n=1 Tax=Mesocestoides corti TaxID=53468 RepID=A0A5K3FQ40_MESCO
MGNIPQYKYSHGNTFGRQTALISARLPYYNGPVTSEKVTVNPRIGSGKISATPKVFKDEIPRDRIPISNADNR